MTVPFKEVGLGSLRQSKGLMKGTALERTERHRLGLRGKTSKSGNVESELGDLPSH